MDDTITIIDLSAFTNPSSSTSEERCRVVSSIELACRKIGFFAIKNHGVSISIQHNLVEASQTFFNLPLEKKLHWESKNEREYPYGYENSERLALGQTQTQKSIESSVADLKETFSMGPDNPLSGMPSRCLPSNPDSLGPALVEYYEAMESLAAIVLSIFARALNLPTNWFQKRSMNHISALRILNYFPVDPETLPPGQCRAGAHTDYGPLTILRTDGPGLQVQLPLDPHTETSSNFQWLDVPIIDNCFVVNLGDLMARWTNGGFRGCHKYRAHSSGRFRRSLELNCTSSCRERRREPSTINSLFL